MLLVSLSRCWSMNNNSQPIWLTCTLLLALLSTGCATLDGPENPDDPFERFNRSVYSFNDTVDKYAIKPIAEGYKKITPGTVDKGITNFFSNLDDVVVLINDLLQFNFTQAASDLSRIMFNTTVGVLGIMDVATDLGLKKHNEDFGQTLAVWGIKDSPYLVLPFIGPSSIRDGAGFVVDTYEFDLTTTELDGREEIFVIGLKYIDIRADLLQASNLLEEIAPDPYAFTRDAWVQRRRYLIDNGEPPADTKNDDEFFEDDLFKDDIIRK